MAFHSTFSLNREKLLKRTHLAAHLHGAAYNLLRIAKLSPASA